MKLPSVTLLVSSTVTTLFRFAVPIIFTVCGTGIALYFAQDYKISEERTALLTKLILICALGLPLLTAWKIMVESRALSIASKILLLLLSFTLLGIFYWSLGGGKDIEFEKHVYRFIAWNITFHLLVAFAAFTSYTHLNGFWQFNKHLFIRFLTAVLYSGVLFVGLAGAILAVQKLFGVKIHGKRHAQLWMFIAGIFNTVFFFGGIPKNIRDLDTQHDYPTGLKLFTQYVLIPLVSLYLVILYAYMGKIAIQMQLPKGWVSNLILVFSVSGIFSLLLVHPIRNLEENKWIQLFSRFYYFSLLPMVALLFIAIGRRISDYGITIERYLVATLGVWLLLIALYFIFSKKKNIIVIPVTLAFIFFFTSFGSWGAFKVSERNQIARLLALYEKVGVLQQGKIVKMPANSADRLYIEDAQQIYSIVNYLSDYHSLKGLEPYMSDTTCINKFTFEKSRWNSVSALESCTGIKQYSRYGTAEYEEKYSFNNYNIARDSGLVITGYDRFYEFASYKNDYGYYDAEKTELLANIKLGSRISFNTKGKEILSVDITDYCKKLKPLHTIANDNKLNIDKMSIETITDNGLNYKIIFRNISFGEVDSNINLIRINGYLLLKNEESD